ncbi:Cysteine desulfurase [Planococcus halocryophilus Or1]|uniref:Cysteine desulfurase n=1 Tax=Planococcus halocryophilus TaxID=1215089 RepID=A0A1C7DR37_9BACL|nr:IscS subfamily cysteine desulfurase [Planococcus halocryophilus]ANU13874.1 cysteine desulfurase [Planococcus halocryophilus]EMF47540.1 Cysteine desulfurase [Planococcus halocryophilus Or1]
MAIYLDYAATAPMRESAIEAYVTAAREVFGNTQSLHDNGSDALRLYESCRRMWGELLNVRGEGMYFTGNASEGNQLAIRSLLRGRKGGKREIVTTQLEHASVLTTLNELEKEGYRIRYVPVDKDGVLELEEYKKMITDQTALVVIQLVNSEMGAIQPIAKCAAFAKMTAVPFHCDIVQAVGKIPLDLASLGVTSAVCSGHKIGGPKGVGIVWLDPSIHWESTYEGTVHQQGFRAGTIDVPAIVSATIATKEAMSEQKQVFQHAENLQSYLKEHLPDDVEMIGKSVKKSPFILGILLPHVEGQWMMLECNRHQVAISTGTACKIGAGEAMSAMSAIGIAQDAARKFIRLSISRNTTKQELDTFLQILRNSMAKTMAR